LIHLIGSFLFFAKISLCSSDRFESEFLWPQIEPLKKSGELDRFIEDRNHELEALNEAWRPFVMSESLPMLREGNLVLQQEGADGSYVLYDSQGNPEFMIKPNDEHVFCLNNPKRFASPFREMRSKTLVPLYKGAQTDAACYEIANICGLRHITPKTVLALLYHPQFFPQQEKLCSIQEYVKDYISLRKILESFFKEGFSEEELLDRFDLEDFENVMLFLWLICDSDAHIDNFLSYPKRLNQKGDTVYGILKIDNSLALPETHFEFSSPLMYLPHALLPLSCTTREKIQRLSLEELKKIIEKFRLESSFSAFEERIFLLQKVIEDKEATYYECSLRLSFRKI